MMYGLHLNLAANISDAEKLLEAVDEVAEQLAALEDVDLLDFGLGADATSNTVEVDVTVEATSPEQAMTRGIGWIRCAIHAAGAGTPGWESGVSEAAQLVEYSLTEATTTPLVPA